TPGRNLSRYDGNNTIITDGPFFDQMNKEQMEIFIYPFVLVIIYMVVGFIGNSIVIYIFTAKWKLTKTTVFILTLAGVDLMSCLINMPTEAAILWNPISFDNDIICKISRFTTFIASVSSSFVLVAISIDRYLMVCRPFLGRELDVKYAKKTCFVAVLLGLVTTWPSLIFYGTFTYHDKVVNSYTNELVTIETKTCLISNFYVENYKLPAGFYFFLFGGHVIMFVILTMLYLLIGRSLFMSTDGGKVTQEKRHSLKYFGLSIVSAFTGTVPNSPNDNRDKSQSVESRARLNRIIADELRHSEVKEFSLRSNTLMMRMVTIAFVISFFPYLVIVTLRYSNPDIPNKLGIAEQIAYHVFLRTYFINSMINPFIYGFMNMEFRAKLKELFCAFCTKYSFRSPVNM
ncbi:TLR1-like protein, partial [Mya arenaria]